MTMGDELLGRVSTWWLGGTKQRTEKCFERYVHVLVWIDDSPAL